MSWSPSIRRVWSAMEHRGLNNIRAVIIRNKTRDGVDGSLICDGSPHATTEMWKWSRAARWPMALARDVDDSILVSMKYEVIRGFGHGLESKFVGKGDLMPITFVSPAAFLSFFSTNHPKEVRSVLSPNALYLVGRSEPSEPCMV